jgi:hypothetical protein
MHRLATSAALLGLVTALHGCSPAPAPAASEAPPIQESPAPVAEDAAAVAATPSSTLLERWRDRIGFASPPPTSSTWTSSDQVLAVTIPERWTVVTNDQAGPVMLAIVDRPARAQCIVTRDPVPPGACGSSCLTSSTPEQIALMLSREFRPEQNAVPRGVSVGQITGPTFGATMLRYTVVLLDPMDQTMYRREGRRFFEYAVGSNWQYEISCEEPFSRDLNPDIQRFLETTELK